MRHLVRAIALITLSLGLSSAASAQNHRACTTKGMAGDWGYTKTGTLYTPAGATPFATMGILTFDHSGTLTGVNTGSVGGQISNDVLTGSIEMNSDCTGTMTVEVRDQAGTLLRTIQAALVVDENRTHLRGLVTSLVLPNGVSLKSVITAEAKRVFEGRLQED